MPCSVNVYCVLCTSETCDCSSNIADFNIDAYWVTQVQTQIKYVMCAVGNSYELI